MSTTRSDDALFPSDSLIEHVRNEQRKKQKMQTEFAGSHLPLNLQWELIVADIQSFKPHLIISSLTDFFKSMT